jgi:pyruvate formate lyase activating enzyme
MKAEAVMKEIEKALPFIRGITVSGGECTLYPVFLCELGEMAREKGLTFFLDTNGSFYFSERKPEKASRGAWDDAARLFERTDAVMLDLKADPDNPEEHRRVTGRGGYDILAQAEFLGRAGKLYELRTVVSPGLFDAAALVDKACRRMAGIDPRLQYRLIRYRPVGVRPAEAAELSVPDDHLMEKLAGICRDHGIKAVVV